MSTSSMSVIFSKLDLFSVVPHSAASVAHIFETSHSLDYALASQFTFRTRTWQAPDQTMIAALGGLQS